MEKKKKTKQMKKTKLTMSISHQPSKYNVKKTKNKNRDPI